MFRLPVDHAEPTEPNRPMTRPEDQVVSAVTTPDARVSRRMARQERRDTAPELRLRKSLFARGLRYRVDAPLPRMTRRRADVLFPRRKVAVFVDGCFWHACPFHGTVPHSNHDWWATKLQRNVTRDRGTDEHLAALGWIVLRFWEHEDMDEAAAAVERVIRDREC